MKPKWTKHQRGKNKTTATFQYGLRYESEDETKVSVVGIKGITSTTCTSSNLITDEKKREWLFYLKFISTNDNIDTLVDIGSQANLIFEGIVKRLGLKTELHIKPYPLRWVCKNALLQVTKQCRLRFSINADFIDEVDLDVIPLDICGMVLSSPYLFDRKAMFHREHNQYHFLKDGNEYIVRSHRFKTNLFMVSTT